MKIFFLFLFFIGGILFSGIFLLDSLAARGVARVSASMELDSDGDGIVGELDLCPHIPSSGGTNGCPRFSFRPRIETQTPETKITIPFQESGLSFRQKREIQLRDEFQAVIRDMRTGEIFVESNVVRVDE